MYVTEFLIEFVKKTKKVPLRSALFNTTTMRSGQKTQQTAEFLRNFTHNVGRSVCVKPADFNK